MAVTNERAKKWMLHPNPAQRFSVKTDSTTGQKQLVAHICPEGDTRNIHQVDKASAKKRMDFAAMAAPSAEKDHNVGFYKKLIDEIFPRAEQKYADKLQDDVKWNASRTPSATATM